MLYGGDGMGGRERERDMTVIGSVDQSAFTQYQDKEVRKTGRRKRRGRIVRRGDTNTKGGN